MKTAKPETNPAGPVLFCGDPHGQFGHIVETAQATKASAVILLGDMDARRPLHEEFQEIRSKIWWIHGNHDTDSVANFEHLWDSQLADRHLHGRVVTLSNGLRLAGLGGVFRKKVWDVLGPRPYPAKINSREEHARQTPKHHCWRDGPSLRHWSTIYADDIDRLGVQQADILVTHEAPGYHPHGVFMLDILAQTMGAKIVVHGHHHDCIDSSRRWIQQGFRSFGVGLRGIMALDGAGGMAVVREGERDGQRTVST